MCLSGGHVGCFDSSPGTHATWHFIETDHPVMVAALTRHGDGATFTKRIDKEEISKYDASTK